MITEKEKTPITFNGVDGFEVLVSDDLSGKAYCPCDVCMYQDFPSFDDDVDASCAVVHGCGELSDDYFLFYTNDFRLEGSILSKGNV